MTPATSAPRIALFTPSYNQAAFLEEAIRSVLDQNYPALEYVVIDGGSTDGSVEIIRRYASRLASWVSEPDCGQYDAVNKGFARTQGEIMGWLNSDDKHTPWTLSVVGELFATFPEIEWLTTLWPLFWDDQGRAVACGTHQGFSREAFWRGEQLPGADWHTTHWIQQESTFWRRSLWEKAGAGLDLRYALAGDFELWARFYRHAELHAVATPLGGFRLQAGQKTASQAEAYIAQAREAFLAHGGRPPGRCESFLLEKLAKLRRFLERKYEKRLRFPQAQHHVVHRGREGGWHLKNP